eukprot:12018-Heterococcus_DN1.PRE.1
MLTRQFGHRRVFISLSGMSCGICGRHTRGFSWLACSRVCKKCYKESPRHCYSSKPRLHNTIQVRFKLDRKQLDEIPQFAVEPEHFRLLGVRFKYPMLGTPMPADISKRVYSDYGPDLSAADNNVLVLVRDAARLAHVPPKERGLL